jgi:hypothetical protein
VEYSPKVTITLERGYSENKLIRYPLQPFVHFLQSFALYRGSKGVINRKLIRIVLNWESLEEPLSKIDVFFPSFIFRNWCRI